MEKVTGIGGLFIRARDPSALGRWYQEHLGVTLLPDPFSPPLLLPLFRPALSFCLNASSLSLASLQQFPHRLLQHLFDLRSDARDDARFVASLAVRDLRADVPGAIVPIGRHHYWFAGPQLLRR